MRWCLSWWTPEGGMQVLLAAVFWAAVAALVVVGWRRVRRNHNEDGAEAEADQPLAGAGERGSR